MFSEAFWGEVLKVIVPTLAGIAGIIVALRTHHTVEVDRARKKTQRRTDLEPPVDDVQTYEAAVKLRDAINERAERSRARDRISGAPGRDL